MPSQRLVRSATGGRMSYGTMLQLPDEPRNLDNRRTDVKAREEEVQRVMQP